MVRHKSKGQATAEMAIVLPLLLIILLGCLDLGRAFSVWVTLTNGTREGARYGSMYPADTGAIAGAAQAEIAAGGLSSGVSVAVSLPGGAVQGSPVVVSASYDLPLISTYLLGAQRVTISASTRMAILVGG